GISADMALRLSEALSTSPEFWLNLQVQYDLWIASQNKRPTIQHLAPAMA
ncbi:HigA family addiction module antidote protein, partial [Acinetobacter baumannii]|nr:HigA family addiction module antidote protein [Acinetobacter baumannii]